MAPKLHQSANPPPNDRESPVSVLPPGAEPYGFDFCKNRIFVIFEVFQPTHRRVGYFTDDGPLTLFIASGFPNGFQLFQGMEVIQEPAVAL